MKREKTYDYVVVGAGIVGLATALEIRAKHPEATICLLEKERVEARHQTSHNSGVVHAGIYYKPGSLKASLCREGLLLTRNYCQTHGLDYQATGKLIVAKNLAELPRLEKLIANAEGNGVSFSVWDQQTLNANEPNISGVRALFSPETAIVDYAQISAQMKRDLESQNVDIMFDFNVTRIDETDTEVQIFDNKLNNKVLANHAVFCTGLSSDRIATLAGLEHGYRVIPFKGTYFEVFRKMSSRLIYPVPDPALPFLGVHYTLHTDGTYSVGPNASLALSRVGYAKFALNLRDVFSVVFFAGFWKLVKKYFFSVLDEATTSLSRRRYLSKVRQLIPDIKSLDMARERTFGIRAQIVDRNGHALDDFVFLDTARTVHVINAPSPAATASMAIAKMIVERMGEK